MNTYICIGQIPNSYAQTGHPICFKQSPQFSPSKLRVNVIDITQQPFYYSNTHILLLDTADITALLLTTNNIRIIPYDIDITLNSHTIQDSVLIAQLYNACIELNYSIFAYPLSPIYLAYTYILHSGTIQS